MKLDVPANVVASSGMQQTSEFKIKAGAHAFKILSSGLYSDKLGAVLREIGCNAADAHIAAGTPDLPFEVHLPTRLVNKFYIRDYGPGLSPDEVISLYTTYFSSSKSQSNEFTGAFGLGSKSPFAYADRFSIVSWHAGIETQYMAYVGDNGSPNISTVYSKPSAEHSGMQISMVVKPEDYHEITTKAHAIFRYFRVKPRMLNAAPIESLKYSEEHENWAVLVNQSGDGRIRVVMGNVAYPIRASDIEAECGSDVLNWAGIAEPELRFKIGEIDIAASREQIELTPRTRDALSARLRIVLKAHTAAIAVTLKALDLSSIKGLLAARELLTRDSRMSRLWQAAAVAHSLDPAATKCISGLIRNGSYAMVPPGLPVTECTIIQRHYSGKRNQIFERELRPGQFNVSLNEKARVLLDDGAKYKRDRLSALGSGEELYVVTGDEALVTDFATKLYNMPLIKLSDMPLPTGWVPKSRRPRQPKAAPSLIATAFVNDQEIHENVLEWKTPNNYYVFRRSVYGRAIYETERSNVNPQYIAEFLGKIHQHLPGCPTRIAALTRTELKRYDLDKTWKPIDQLADDLLKLPTTIALVDTRVIASPTLPNATYPVPHMNTPVLILAAHCRNKTPLWSMINALVPKSKLIAEAAAYIAGAANGNARVPIRYYNDLLNSLGHRSACLPTVTVADDSSAKYPMLASALRADGFAALVQKSVHAAASVMASLIIADETGALPNIDCTKLAA